MKGVVVLAVLAAGCGRIGFDPVAGGSDATASTAQLLATDENALYAVNVATLQETAIAPFFNATGARISVAELAIDVDGNVWGIDNGPNASLYTVDPDTGLTEEIGPLTPTAGTRGLAVVPPGVVGSGATLLLTIGNQLYEVDRATGSATLLFAAGTAYDGDMAWHDGDAVLYGSLEGPGASAMLAVIDVSNGAQTIVGSVPRDHILGLAVIDDRLYAFSREGVSLELDRSDGSIIREHRTADLLRWQGAAP